MSQNDNDTNHNQQTLTQKIIHSKLFKGRRRTAVLMTLAVVVLTGGIAVTARAETYPGGTDNGLTSRIVTLTNALIGLGYGSSTNSPNWGADWNQIATASKWTPSGNTTAAQVNSGTTFYSASRTQSTGTYPDAGPCSTQAYHDGYGAPVTQTTNCTVNVVWTVESPSVTGDDSGTGNTDPRTGLTWSKYLENVGGTITFVTSSGSSWSWDASAAANVAVGNKTAIQLCSSLGNGWRLPTQKELMQAYIDGSYFNLTNPSNVFWSATQYSSTFAWYVYLSNGATGNVTNTSTSNVRCVRYP